MSMKKYQTYLNKDEKEYLEKMKKRFGCESDSQILRKLVIDHKESLVIGN